MATLVVKSAEAPFFEDSEVTGAERESRSRQLVSALERVLDEARPTPTWPTEPPSDCS